MLAAGDLPNLGAPARGIARRPPLDHPPTHHAGLGDDGDRRQRRPARDLGLHRARRERLPPRLVNGSFRRAPALWDRLRPPGGAWASSTSRSPGRRPRWTASRCRLRRRRARGRHDLSPHLLADLRAGSARPSSTTVSRSTPRQRRPRPRAARRRAEGRVAALARRALRPRAPLRRLHGRRPRPPPLLARLGRATAPRAAWPTSTASSTRRRRLVELRAARERHGRLRPRRRRLSRRRQPQRLARHARAS